MLVGEWMTLPALPIIMQYIPAVVKSLEPIQNYYFITAPPSGSDQTVTNGVLGDTESGDCDFTVGGYVRYLCLDHSDLIVRLSCTE